MAMRLRCVALPAVRLSEACWGGMGRPSRALALTSVSSSKRHCEQDSRDIHGGCFCSCLWLGAIALRQALLCVGVASVLVLAEVAFCPCLHGCLRQRPWGLRYTRAAGCQPCSLE